MSERSAGLGALRLGRVLVWLVYAFFVLAVVILTITFFLLLFNASPSAPFTQWMYRSADRLLKPFRGIFPSAEAGNGSVFDAAILFAILMYGLFAMFVHWIVTLLDDRVYVIRARAADKQVPVAAAPVPEPAAPAAP
ncbi:MAG: YggT family protein, partial [Acidimicrobiia bacterium]|nr:YggT family protein [Acidimicrobiia bacterium]